LNRIRLIGGDAKFPVLEAEWLIRIARAIFTDYSPVKPMYPHRVNDKNRVRFGKVLGK